MTVSSFFSTSHFRFILSELPRFRQLCFFTFSLLFMSSLVLLSSSKNNKDFPHMYKTISPLPFKGFTNPLSYSSFFCIIFFIPFMHFFRFFSENISLSTKAWYSFVFSSFPLQILFFQLSGSDLY